MADSGERTKTGVNGEKGLRTCILLYSLTQRTIFNCIIESK